MSSPKGIAVLGSTGSIGIQTLDVIACYPERFRVIALACNRSAEEIAAQAVRHRPGVIALADDDAAEVARQRLQNLPVEITSGPEAVVACALRPDVDLVVGAASGITGLLPVWEAVRAGKTVALANKEPLVVAGDLITAEARRTGARLIPVDSEHSAIFQLLLGQDRKAARRVILTASGGAFRDLTAQELERVTAQQALAHPTWKMGPKVTVDSATLMNKGLEVIEARWLFALAPEQIEVVLHPESIMHSVVEFTDGTMLAHLARPDMRLPIQFALSYPERLPRSEPPLDLTRLGALHFSEVPLTRYPCLRLAREALAAGGTAPAALNAADEVAVEWFLQGRIEFTRIAEIIETTLASHGARPADSIDALFAVDREVRARLEKDQSRWMQSSAFSPSG